MMLTELASAIKKAGFNNLAYRRFLPGKRVPTPFVVYYEDETQAIYADNTCYFAYAGITVELYTDKKMPVEEEKLEAVFRQHQWAFIKTELFVESEQLILIKYELEGL